MTKRIKWFALGAVVAAGAAFIVCNIYKSSRPPATMEPPELDRSPARVYGRVEPAGGEVYVSPNVTRAVKEILVKEREAVAEGQVLCLLENDVERAQLRVGQARVAALSKAVELSADTFERNAELYGRGQISEYEYEQAKLKAELDARDLNVAFGELALARARLEQLELKAPIDGVVYKLDVRLGETLAAGDNTRIILGSDDLWVRMYVESFWTGRVKDGAKYKVYDSETDEYVGVGTVVQRNPYVGGRDFQSGDLQERFDTKFQEVILRLEPKKKNIPLGLNVMAELAGGE
ncbi:MAG: HlyD family efflux transporter periplasmic adaptor subunit [candidate division Zixibacteria bacterium]|nr:HlyD family efflux transporter periplasmic adaptor subunit [candidate division Zixibacteria bacterium]